MCDTIIKKLINSTNKSKEKSSTKAATNTVTLSIWSAIYRKNLTESAILLKYIQTESENDPSLIAPHSKKMLGTACDKFLKVNDQVRQNNESPNLKQGMKWLDEMCREVKELCHDDKNGWFGSGNSKDPKNKKEHKQANSSNFFSLSTLFSIIGTIIYYSLISLFIIVITNDLYNSNGSWKKCQTRKLLVSWDHTGIAEGGLRTIENSISGSTDFVIQKSVAGYNQVKDFNENTKQTFEIVEDLTSTYIGQNLILLEKFLKKEVVPHLVKAMKYSDVQVTKLYIYIKANQIDTKIIMFFKNFKGNCYYFFQNLVKRQSRRSLSVWW